MPKTAPSSNFGRKLRQKKHRCSHVPHRVSTRGRALGVSKKSGEASSGFGRRDQDKVERSPVVEAFVADNKDRRQRTLSQLAVRVAFPALWDTCGHFLVGTERLQRARMRRALSRPQTGRAREKGVRDLSPRHLAVKEKLRALHVLNRSLAHSPSSLASSSTRSSAYQVPAGSRTSVSSAPERRRQR
jgi:hypothetical protein